MQGGETECCVDRTAPRTHVLIRCSHPRRTCMQHPARLGLGAPALGGQLHRIACTTPTGSGGIRAGSCAGDTSLDGLQHDLLPGNRGLPTERLHPPELRLSSQLDAAAVPDDIRLAVSRGEAAPAPPTAAWLGSRVGCGDDDATVGALVSGFSIVARLMHAPAMQSAGRRQPTELGATAGTADQHQGSAG